MKINKTDLHIIETGDKIIKKFPNGDMIGRIELNSEIEDFKLTVSKHDITITKIDNMEKITKIDMRIDKFKELLELFNIIIEIKNNESNINENC